MSLLSAALDPLLTLLYPPRCLTCHTLGTSSSLCETCLQSILPVPAPQCPCCGQSLADKPHCLHCTTRKPSFVRSRALGAYNGTLRTAIHLLKYRDRPQLAEPLGAALAKFAREQASALHDLQFDAVIPIPIHAIRRRQRGYNQSERLARVLCRELQLRLETQSLIRTRNTPPQVGLTGQARARNLYAAFAVRQPEHIFGKVLLMVDDVSTTSSTLHEAASALKDAGAQEVYGLTLAAG